MSRWALLAALGMLLGCGASERTGFTTPDGGGGGGPGDGSVPDPDATMLLPGEGGGGSDGSVSGDGGGTAHSCNPTSDDLQSCSCPTLGGMRACYTGPPGTRNQGQCKDGMQTCSGVIEAPEWGPCTGSILPGLEVCNATIDANCNGKTGCNDPTCSTTPYCNTGCTDGQTRPCYTGPTGTENVGVCKDGTQTCANNTWGACTGEVDPQPVNCCDAIDHACTGVIGCFNLFQCITASCCQSSCDAGGGLDPGCVCMTGSGDTATCPKGDKYVHKGGLPGTDECCPCQPSDCGDFNCCGEAVCAGSSACSNETCKTLPASCNGQVNADCDDFPEDCDEPCCECNDGTCP